MRVQRPASLVQAPRMTRRSFASSGLRNGEHTACHTADFTPLPGREADLGQVRVVHVAD